MVGSRLHQAGETWRPLLLGGETASVVVTDPGRRRPRDLAVIHVLALRQVLSHGSTPSGQRHTRPRRHAPAVRSSDSWRRRGGRHREREGEMSRDALRPSDCGYSGEPRPELGTAAHPEGRPVLAPRSASCFVYTVNVHIRASPLSDYERIVRIVSDCGSTSLRACPGVGASSREKVSTWKPHSETA